MTNSLEAIRKRLAERQSKWTLSISNDRFIAHAPDDIDFLLVRVAKLEEALRWYADEKNYVSHLYETGDPDPEVVKDEGQRAREALGDE